MAVYKGYGWDVLYFRSVLDGGNLVVYELYEQIVDTQYCHPHHYN